MATMRHASAATAEYRRMDPPQPRLQELHQELRHQEVHHEHRTTTEPSNPQQVSFVDGKCRCCPYGYHIDLDFLKFCQDMEKGSTLQNLKRIQKAKRKLRKSMEIMLDEQGGMMATDPQSTPPDLVHSTEAGRLMHMINYERSATNRILNQIDSSVNTTIGQIEGGRGRRYLSSDSDEPGTPNMPYGSTPRGFDESGVTPSSFASGRTDSLSSLSSVSTMSSESPMMYQQMYHQQQLQHHQHSKGHRSTTKVIENPVIEMATAEMKHYSSHSSAQLVDNGLDEMDAPPLDITPERASPVHSSSSRASPDINQMSLQSVREAMAVSLTRLRELEQQVKAIPILQVRISVLKEEKRLLNLQLKANKANNTRTVGVGDANVHIDVNRSPLKSPPPTLPKPVRTVSVGVGDHSVIEPYLAQPDLPTGYTVRENETHTEIHTTSVLEKESIFQSRITTPSLSMSFKSPSFEEKHSRNMYASENQPRFTINQIHRSAPRALTRTIGIGDGNVFEGSGLHVHEKEMRTVIIGSSANVAKRNVGIECRVPTRDVGVSFMCDEEKPQTRTIGVNVNYDTSNILTSLDFKGETELRMALRGVLQRNVRSVGTNCDYRLATSDAAVSTDFIGVSVGCGDEQHRIDVDIRPIVSRKSVAVAAKPEVGTKCISTEKGWALDASTNTVMIDKYSKSVMTDRPRQVYASSNTEPVLTRPASNQTEVKMFLAMDQLKNAQSNTQKITTYSTGISTDIIPTYNAAVNTMERGDTFSQKSRTNAVQEKKKNLIDRGVGDFLIDGPYDESSSPTRKSVTVQEQIIQKGATQANAFLQGSSSLSSDVKKDDAYRSSIDTYEITRENSVPLKHDYISTTHSARNSGLQQSETVSTEESKSIHVTDRSHVERPTEFSSYDLTRRSSAPLSNSLQESQLKSRSSSQGWKRDQKMDSPSKEEDSFQETITEHYVFTKDGKQLISEEKMKSVTSGGKTTNSKSTVYGPGVKYGSSNESSLYSDSNSRFSGSSLSSSSRTGYSSDLYSDSSKMSSTTDYTDDSNQSIKQGSYSSSSAVVTNPYRTVQNLAEMSSLLDSESVQSSTSSFKEVSKTRSESNLSRDISTLSESGRSTSGTTKSMETIYDMRRAGSVEDFMPDDIRRYMSIDPSTSKDSGFGEELHQKFSEDSSTVSSTGSRSPRYSKISKTVTKRRKLRSGDKVSVLETKIVEGPDGKTVTTYSEKDDDGNEDEKSQSDSSRSVNLDGNSEKSALSETMQSSISSYSSSASSGYVGGGSDTNLTSTSYTQHSLSDFGSHSRSSSGGMSVSETTVSTVGEDGLSGSRSETANYGSLDRKTGKLKSIMKHTKSDTEKLSGKKGITFAESVIGGTGSSSDGHTSDSDSASSYEEGSYDSRQGEVSFQCQDDEAIAQGLPGAQMFDQNIREIYELSDEMSQACDVLATYLTDSTTITTKQLNASTNIVQQEWFRVSSHKLSSPHQVEDYLSSVNEISKRLLEYIVNMSDANGNTAIHYCISHCNLEIASLLLDSEVCDINRQNKAGYTPIMLAGLASVQGEDQREVIRRLFAKGDINARATATQQTALMLAASHGRTEMVRLLVEEGADYNLQDIDGSTALMCACEHGHLEIVTFLLAQPNIDAEATDNENSTALTIAMEADHKDVGVVLYKHLNFSKVSSPHTRVSMKIRKAVESTL